MSLQTRYSGGTVFDHWLVGSYLGGSANHQTAVFVLTHKSCEGLYSAMKAVNLVTREGSPGECQRAAYQSVVEERTNTAVQEVRLMNELKGHPNIVAYLDHTAVDWVEPGCFGRDLLIRMELLTDLRKLMQQGKMLPEKEITKIGKDICAALTCCHQRSILHRDVKPENIFVDKNGVYKLGDFGISRILDSAANDHASTGIGTPQYASPEQFAQSYDRRADIYSLGLVLYELCNENRLPFADSSYFTPECVRRRLSGEGFPELNAASRELSDAISRACRFQPEERYPSAEEFSTALLGGAVPGAAQSPLAEEPVEKPEKKPARWLLPASAILIAAALVLALPRFIRAALLKTDSCPSDGTQMVSMEQTVPADGFTFDLLADGSVSITGFEGEASMELILPATIQGMPVSEVGENAFSYMNVQRVILPEGVTKIGPYAFLGCERLKEIALPDTLKTLEYGAFMGCEQLKEVRLPEGLQTVKGHAFNFTGITSVFIPASVSHFEETFLSCRNLTQIQVAEENPCYSSENGVLFNKEKTVLLRWPAGYEADEYRIAQGVTALGDNAFEGTYLTSLELPEGLQSIGENCFLCSEQLKELTIPASVRYIAEGAFANCTSMNAILVADGNKDYASSDGILYSVDLSELVAFPASRAGSFTVPDTVSTLGEAAFSGSRLSQLIIPEGIKVIPPECFACCYSLRSITIPEGVEEIRSSAFRSCEELSQIELPTSLRYIACFVFDSCIQLREVRIPNENCIVEENAFPEGCRVIR